MSDGSDAFDLNAAWMRKAQGDLGAFMEAFATRMTGALPGRVAVERKREGFFSSRTRVVKVTIETGQHIYSLVFDSARLAAQRAKAVRGVTLKSEILPVPEWLAALNHEVEALSGELGAARRVIHDFLMS